ncbi:MAG: hypothetical protein JWP03_1840, partial [Phycisphaerales bacterium]|nr:hypothetical protein [Phycisphaerales bacterium]
PTPALPRSTGGGRKDPADAATRPAFGTGADRAGQNCNLIATMLPRRSCKTFQLITRPERSRPPRPRQRNPGSDSGTYRDRSGRGVEVQVVATRYYSPMARLLRIAFRAPPAADRAAMGFRDAFGIFDAFVCGGGRDVVPKLPRGRTLEICRPTHRSGPLFCPADGYGLSPPMARIIERTDSVS